jgi:hypothetical protein
MPAFIKRYAAWLASMVTSGVSLAVAFGWHLSGEQVSAITSIIAVAFGTGIQVQATVKNGNK